MGAQSPDSQAGPSGSGCAKDRPWPLKATPRHLELATLLRLKPLHGSPLPGLHLSPLPGLQGPAFGGQADPLGSTSWFPSSWL